MLINSRNKGKAGELEICQMLRDELGIDANRKLEQTAVGGVDVIAPQLDWAIEVKRAKTPRFDAWWTQAVDQAGGQKKPVLIYRLDRKPWIARICLCASYDHAIHGQIDMPVETWLAIAREQLC